MSEFAPGDLVEYVDDSNPTRGWCPRPRLGGIYTVAAVRHDLRGNLGLILREVRTGLTLRNGHETGYLARRFRKIKKPDISALRELVANPREKVS